VCFFSIGRLTYDDVNEIRELYNGYRHLDYHFQYTAQERYEGSEVIFFSHNLTLPPTPIEIKKRLLVA
jgi:DNA adenine methylase